MRSYQRAWRRSTHRFAGKPFLAAVCAVLTVVCVGAAATAERDIGGAQHRRGVTRNGTDFQVLGSPSCRTCHRSIFQQWQRSPHALSADKLSFEQTFDPTCEPCHVPDASAFEDGVGCEACHGPGSEYAALDVMIDELKRRSAGLQDAASNCVACHNPGHDFHVERDLAAAARTIHAH